MAARSLAFALCVALAASTCPSPESLRSESTLSDFDSSLIAGHWYEVAYTDPAQAGASCQETNNTVTADGTVSQLFSCNYAVVPFGMVYTYAPRSGDDEAGVYDKYVKGTQWLLNLPTTIVDVRLGDDGEVALMSEFTCVDKVGDAVEAIEFRISSREQTIDTDVLNDMMNVARSAGVPNATLEKVAINDYSAC